MNTQKEITIEQLNDIQKQWMELQHDDPKEKQARVYKLMEDYPQSYLSINKDRTKANVVYRGMPCFAEGQPLQDALDYAWHNNVQTQFAWQCPDWIELKISLWLATL